MRFRLNLTISGLCMFVPGPGASPQVMYVLMPNPARYGAGEQPDLAPDHAGGHHEPHTACLMYDRECRVPDSEALKGEATQCAEVRLNGCVAEFAHRAGGKLKPAVDTEYVVCLTPSAHFTGVPRAYVEGPLVPSVAEHVAARVALRVGEATGYPDLTEHPGKRPKYCLGHENSKCGENGTGQQARVMTEHVTWSLGEYEESVALEDVLTVTPMPTNGSEQWLRGRLRPRRGETSVEVRLLYVVPQALANGLCRKYVFPDLGGANARNHFPMFYRLAADPTNEPMTTIPETSSLHDLAVSPLVPSVVCMTSQSTIADG